MRKFLFILMSLGLLILLAKVAVVLGEENLVFSPAAEPREDPATIDLSFHNVSFKTSDGLTLTGWFIPGGKDAPVVLYFHDARGNMSDCLDFLQAMKTLDVSWFIFDYRQFGRSAGRISEAGFYRDAEAAYEACRRRFAPAADRIILWGTGLGTAAAAHVGFQHHAAGMILESPFISAGSLAGNNILKQVLFMLSDLKLENAQDIIRSDMPKLIIHGSANRQVSIDEARRIVQMATPTAEFYPVDGDNPGSLYRPGGQGYQDRIRSFITHLVPGGNRLPSATGAAPAAISRSTAHTGP